MGEKGISRLKKLFPFKAIPQKKTHVQDRDLQLKLYSGKFQPVQDRASLSHLHAEESEELQGY